MPNETPLDILIDLAQEKLEETAKLLAELGRQRREAKHQLEALDNYRADYARQLQEHSNTGLTISNYHNFRRFISTLDDAIGQQNDVINQLDVRLQSGRLQWADEKRRLSSFETLKTRKQRELIYREARREQRASDETSAAMYRRRQINH